MGPLYLKYPLVLRSCKEHIYSIEQSFSNSGLLTEILLYISRFLNKYFSCTLKQREGKQV